MRKLGAQLYIFLLLFLTWQGLHEFPPVWTAGRISGPLPLFPQIQIDLLNSRDPSLVQDALKETEKALLRFFNPGLAGESWDSNFIFLDLIPGGEPEAVIALSLPPDRGYLAVLQKQNQHYILVYYEPNLLPFIKLDKLAHPGQGDFLVTREEHNEMMGAFFESRIVKIWSWGKNTLCTAWSENYFWEVNWLNTWQDTKASEQKWFKLIQEFAVNYRPSPQPVVILQGQQVYLETAGGGETLPAPHRFQTKAVRHIDEEFIWNEEWQRFILHTGTFFPDPGSTGQKVAILKDMEHHLEYMVLQEKKMYEVLDSKGKVFLVEKTDVKLKHGLNSEGDSTPPEF